MNKIGTNSVNSFPFNLLEGTSFNDFSLSGKQKIALVASIVFGGSLAVYCIYSYRAPSLKARVTHQIEDRPLPVATPLIKETEAQIITIEKQNEEKVETFVQNDASKQELIDSVLRNLSIPFSLNGQIKEEKFLGWTPSFKQLNEEDDNRTVSSIHTGSITGIQDEGWEVTSATPSSRAHSRSHSPSFLDESYMDGGGILKSEMDVFSKGFEGLRAINGPGKLTYEDRVEEGNFLNGKLEGEGEIKYTNGVCVKGRFQQGKLIEEVAITLMDGTTYRGMLKDHSFIHAPVEIDGAKTPNRKIDFSQIE